MNELVERLDVIEKMIHEGRRSMERWGWAYVVWGTGHLLGVIASVMLPEEQAGRAWGILMSACGITMGLGFSRMSQKRRKELGVETHSNRALTGVWWAFSFVMIFLFLPHNVGVNTNAWLGIFSTAYGGAFFASGYILKWNPMKANGFLWVATGFLMPYLSQSVALVLFGAAALIGEIGFGIYTMNHEKKVLSSAS